MEEIESDHPRAESLRIRKRIAEGFERGLVTPEGLSAHGRGEAFDYLLGEKTTDQAKKAIRAGAAEILLAEKPVLSVNGNVAALVAKEIATLEKVSKIKVEVNLFHKSEERARKIAEYLKINGVKEVLGTEDKYSDEIPEIKSQRRTVDSRGIKTADMVLVPLEDGDRTEALTKIGKTVVTIDLNPLSRTANAADVTIVDNIIRAFPKIIEEVKRLSDLTEKNLEKIPYNFDNRKNLNSSIKIILKRLEKISKD